MDVYTSRINTNNTESNNEENGQLSGYFHIYNKYGKYSEAKVTFTTNGILFERHGSPEIIASSKEIIGAHCEHKILNDKCCYALSCPETKQDGNSKKTTVTTTNRDNQETDNSVYLHIYTYVKSEKTLQRTRNVIILRFQTFEHFEENLQVAEVWRNSIKTYRTLLNTCIMERHLLIFLNPKSGTGKARELFQKFIEPILMEADIPFVLQITTHANFARDFVRQKPDLLKFYCGIVVASGDGLFFEVLNGLMERLDADEICTKLPLGIIPCGSGNGLAKSIAHLHNEAYEPNPILYATLNCVSGKTSPMDIVFVESSNGQRVIKFHSFLSIGWGLIADIDIESESLRLLGGQRFNIWAVRRLMSLRRYKGKLSYLPHLNVCLQSNVEFLEENYNFIPTLDKPPPDDGSWRSEEGNFIMVMAAYTSHLSSSCFFIPQAQLDDGIIYLVIIRDGISRFELLIFLLNLSSGTHLPKKSNKYIEVLPVKAFRIEPFDKNGIMSVDGERVEYGPIQGKIRKGRVNVLVPNN